MSAKAEGEMLRTLHIDTERGWRGGEQQALTLMTGLARGGHAADVVCRRGEPLAARARQAELVTLELAPRGELDLVAAARIARFVALRGHDIIHAHTSHAHMLAVLARGFVRRGARPPLVVSRRVDFDIRKAPFGLSRLKYRIGAPRYLAISSRVRQVLIEGGVAPERVRVVPSAVDLARFDRVSAAGLRQEFAIAPADRVIVNVGALVGHKAQLHLVNAMPRVLERFPQSVCLIVGEGPLRPRLESLARQLALGRRLILTGYRDDALRFMKLADVFAISSEMEGLCSSILEAMALRRPVVATRAGGIPDVVADGVNGLLVPAGDPAALAQAIVALLADGALCARLAAEGRRTVENRFNAEAMVAATLAVYRELLARGGSGDVAGPRGP